MRARNYWNKAFMFALLTAVGTTGYTVMDYTGINIVKGCIGSRMAALVYHPLEGLGTTLLTFALVCLVPLERRNMRVTLTREKKAALFTGIGIYTAYTMVLAANAFVSDASYIAVMRQLSIPVGALAGIFILKEKATGPKLAGIVLIVGGVLLAWAGFKPLEG
jgi:drug/metabolite transporter (DMT)-like permease